MTRLRVPALRCVTFGPLARGLGATSMTQRQAASVAALMYGIGSGLVGASLLMPHDANLQVPVVAAVVTVAAATSALFALVGVRMAPCRFYLATLGGTLLISILVAFGGSNSTAYAMLYVWVAVYAFYFFDTRFALLATLWVVASAAIAEVIRTAGPDQAGGGSVWVMAVGTTAVAGYVIQDLMRRLVATLSADPLTGAANRGSWDEQVARAIALARRQGHAVSVLMVDLDRFKVYNDDHGHQAGDALLMQAVKAWRIELREDDFLARYGGEEFAVLLSGCDATASAVIAERLRAVMPGGQTCSVGAAQLEPGDDSTSLVARADAALYKAKTLGRDRAVIAYPDNRGHDVLAETTRWARTVQELLHLGDTEIAFQPIRNLEGGALLGMEALARPRSDGLTVEGLFATAQRMGRSRDLDWLCRRAALLRAGAIPRGALIFINIAVASLLEDHDCAIRMAALAAEAGIEPGRIVLEVTERENVLNPARLAEALEHHRRQGFRVAVDDVGEGHSTFELLASVVPDYVKVAASLVRRASEPGPRSAIMAAAMFARSSGAALIAEGIEDAEAARTVTLLGANFGQGFHLGHPRTPESDLPARAAQMFAATIIAPAAAV